MQIVEDNLLKILLHLFHFSNNDASLDLYLPIPITAVEEYIREDLDCYKDLM